MRLVGCGYSQLLTPIDTSDWETENARLENGAQKFKAGKYETGVWSTRNVVPCISCASFSSIVFSVAPAASRYRLLCFLDIFWSSNFTFLKQASTEAWICFS